MRRVCVARGPERERKQTGLDIPTFNSADKL